MTIRYERHRESAINLTGGPYAHFPAGVVEIDLDDPEEERRIADHYDAVELVEAETAEDDSDDICGAIKTNGEPCERPADECRWHSQDEDSDEDEDEDDAGAEAEAEDADEDEDDSEDEAPVLGDVEIDVASDHLTADDSEDED